MPKISSLLRGSLKGVCVFCLSFHVFSADYDPATADAEILDTSKASRALFTDIVATDTGAVAVGERGHILKSSNLKDWVQLPVPTRSTLTNVYARGASLWAVGHEEVILHSADGGSTWERQRVDVEALGPLLDVIFLDDSNGFAIGAEGKMFFTSDAGKTWTDRNITELTTQDLRPKVDANEEESGLASDDMGVDETPPHLNAVVQNKIGLLIVGESGAAFRSTDSGLSWARIEIPYHGPLFGAVVLSDDSIIAYGLNGNAFQTSDLGNTWQKLETGTEATLMGAVAVPGGRAVIVGSRGVFLTKAADSNVLKSFTFSDGGILGGVLQRGETDFVVVGENGILAYSPK